MVFPIETNRQPLMILFKVETKQPHVVFLRVEDRFRPIVYTDRFKTINGTGYFLVRLPSSPNVSLISIWTKEFGKAGGGFNLKYKKIELQQKFKISEIRNRNVIDFLNFAQWFCERCKILTAGGSIYVDRTGKFRIDYYDDIYLYDKKSGRYIKTESPSCISAERRVISCAKNKFKDYTYGEGMAILMHEFGHVFLTKIPFNIKMTAQLSAKREEEADLNACLILLGLGYPRIEIEKVFTKIFYRNPSDVNYNRFNKIDALIKQFDDLPMKIL